MKETLKESIKKHRIDIIIIASLLLFSLLVLLIAQLTRKDGAVAIVTVNGETVEMTRVYALSEVDVHNEYYYDIATGTITMVQDGSNWGAAVAGIAAKQLDETIYVAAVYTSDGVSYPTKVIAYSLGNYCKTVAASGEAFGAATAVYGFYAKAYFA